MINTDIYRVDDSLQIETITITHTDKEYVIGQSNMRNERLVARDEIERHQNPMPDEREVRFFDKEKIAQSYVHNALVHKVKLVQDASDKEIVDMLLSTDTESLLGEVQFALAGRAEDIKEKLS